MKILINSKYNFAQKSIVILLLLLIQFQTTIFAIPIKNENFTKKKKLNSELTNQDVLEMVKSNVSTEIIIAKIKNSNCKFDTSPTVINELKKSGVPDSIIMAMIQALPQSNTPNPTLITNQTNLLSQNNINPVSTNPSLSAKKGEIKIPDGTPIEVELTYTIASNEVQEGSTMSFRTIRPVKINGVTVIESGVSVIARVQKASGGGSWGRAGKLEWAMQGTTAVDGSNVPLQFERKTKGTGKGGQVATGVILTSVFVFPLAGLLWGFKKGKSAKIPAGTRFEVLTFGEVTIQTGKSTAELNSLSSGIIDLNGMWTFGEQVVKINQQGSDVSINYVSGKATCNGTAVDHVFSGQIQGNKLMGKMPTCAPLDYVNKCAMPPINELSFVAEISYGKIIGKAIVPQISVTPASNGTCSLMRVPRQDQEFPFSLSRMVIAE